MLLLRVVQFVQQKSALLVKIPPFSGRHRLNHLLRESPHDLLDQSEVEQVVMLLIIAARSPHGLEEQIPREKLHSDARRAPDVRLFVPGKPE